MKRLYRLMVRTSPSQGGNRGSNPLRVTKRLNRIIKPKTAWLCGFFVFFGV